MLDDRQFGPMSSQSAIDKVRSSIGRPSSSPSQSHVDVVMRAGLQVSFKVAEVGSFPWWTTLHYRAASQANLRTIEVSAR